MQEIFKELYIKTTKNVPKDDLERCLREEAAKWACFFNDPLCKKDASKKTRHLFHHHSVYQYRYSFPYICSILYLVSYINKLFYQDT